VSQHVEFAWGQIVARIRAHYAVADRRIDERPSARDRSHRGEQRLGFGVFAHVACCSGAQDAHHPRFISGGGERDDTHVRRAREKALCGLDPVDAAREQQILEDDLRPPLVEPFEQLLTGRRNPDQFQIGKRLEVGLQTATDDAVIVNDGDRDRHADGDPGEAACRISLRRARGHRSR
jgi:hypothetical protein